MLIVLQEYGQQLSYTVNQTKLERYGSLVTLDFINNETTHLKIKTLWAMVIQNLERGLPDVVYLSLIRHISEDRDLNSSEARVMYNFSSPELKQKIKKISWQCSTLICNLESIGSELYAKEYMKVFGTPEEMLDLYEQIVQLKR